MDEGNADDRAHGNTITASAPDSASEFLKEACFAGGSFWILEAAFGCVDGVSTTATGYCGGTVSTPTHKDVCDGETGHTEAVKLMYDGRKVSFRALCDKFWESHDPTKKAYMVSSVDTHYRSAIFYLSEEQRQEAQQSKVRHQMKVNRRIVTKILPATVFFCAESIHQKYYLQSKQNQLCGILQLRSSEELMNSQIACKLNGYIGCMANPLPAIRDFMQTSDLTEDTKQHLVEALVDQSSRSNCETEYLER